MRYHTPFNVNPRRIERRVLITNSNGRQTWRRPEEVLSDQLLRHLFRAARDTHRLIQHVID
jgi:hypothetical protein